MFFIQRSCVHQLPNVIYLAPIIDNNIELCFLLIHVAKLPPIYKYPSNNAFFYRHHYLPSQHLNSQLDSSLNLLNAIHHTQL
jgi:hypothetical protein